MPWHLLPACPARPSAGWAAGLLWLQLTGPGVTAVKPTWWRYGVAGLHPAATGASRFPYRWLVDWAHDRYRPDSADRLGHRKRRFDPRLRPAADFIRQGPAPPAARRASPAARPETG